MIRAKSCTRNVDLVSLTAVLAISLLKYPFRADGIE